MKEYVTEQEKFWAGEFGSEYISRNDSDELLASNISFFSKALKNVNGHLTNCIEFGANIGMNLKALRLLFPTQEQNAIEINNDAINELKKTIPEKNIFCGSIFDYKPEQKFDLTLIKGVLIHINPEYLNSVYDALYNSTKRYLLICEYYNPTPIEISYRGHEKRLFKRDFCGEIQEKYPDLVLVDYGFVYRRDPNFPQDDMNWFLLERR